MDIQTFQQKFFAGLIAWLRENPYSLQYLHCDDAYLLDIEFSVVNNEWIRCHFLRPQLRYSSNFMINPMGPGSSALSGDFESFIEMIAFQKGISGDIERSTKALMGDMESLYKEWFYVTAQYPARGK